MDVSISGDYLIIRIGRGGRVCAPEGSADYSDWLTTRQLRELEEMAARWGEANAREGGAPAAHPPPLPSAAAEDFEDVQRRALEISAQRRDTLRRLRAALLAGEVGAILALSRLLTGLDADDDDDESDALVSEAEH